MVNRFYTLLVIPEKTQRVRRFLVPSWVLRGGLIGGILLAAVGIMMFLNYWFVMGQIDENKDLRVENRRLRQQVQIFNNKLSTVEETMDRIQTFATRLKVITNIEDRDELLSKLDDELPDAAENIGQRLSPPPLLANEMLGLDLLDPRDPENMILAKQQREAEERFLRVSLSSLKVEQGAQDLYELLSDQKSFLSALPTRKPTIGYFTSGFGIRRSPYGGGEKMHEGLDIANRPGTSIKSTAKGTVLFAGPKAGYGQTVIVDHGYGIETWYGHARAVLVKKGDSIHRGKSIALMGSTGRSTGPHVHYEVRVHGIPVDPLTYILEE